MTQASTVLPIPTSSATNNRTGSSLSAKSKGRAGKASARTRSGRMSETGQRWRGTPGVPHHVAGVQNDSRRDLPGLALLALRVAPFLGEMDASDLFIRSSKRPDHKKVGI